MIGQGLGEGGFVKGSLPFFCAVRAVGRVRLQLSRFFALPCTRNSRRSVSIALMPQDFVASESLSGDLTSEALVHRRVQHF